MRYLALRSALSVLPIILGTVVLSVNGPSTAAAAVSGSTAERVSMAASRHWMKAPNDYVGLAKAVRLAGGDSVHFTYPDAGLYNATAEITQQRYNAALESSISADGGVAGVPVNAFSVGGSWIHVQDQSGEFWMWAGNWNYRDNYVGGLGPDNLSAAAVGGFGNCWRMYFDHVDVADWQGTIRSSELAYRQAVDTDSSVWGVRDHVSNHTLWSDHGWHNVVYQRIASGCSEQLHGKYYWEHNQGSRSGWSFSVSLAIFSVSYNSGGVDSLQKSSPLVFTP